MLPSSSNAVEGMRKRRTRPRLAQGLQNEVRHVDLGMGVAATEGQRRPGGREQGMGNGHWRRWLREVGRYIEAAWAAFRGLVILLWAWAWSKAASRRKGVGRRRTRRMGAGRSVDLGSQLGDGAVDGEDGEGEGEESGEEEDLGGVVLYERFLAGDNISDDEDDEFRVEAEGEEEVEEEDEVVDTSTPISRGATPFGDGGEQDSTEREAFSLFTDLMKSQREGSEGPRSSQNVALAHLMSNSSPLTRKRWSESVSRSLIPQSRFGSPGVRLDDEEDEEGEGEEEEEHDQTEDLGKAACVICTSEARDIICWPCRCLAMCDGCREALASRSAPSKHQCPCCRQLIEGYSRIFIP